jgi:hypothetical protein
VGAAIELSIEGNERVLMDVGEMWNTCRSNIFVGYKIITWQPCKNYL